jgi:Transposase DDE domain
MCDPTCVALLCVLGCWLHPAYTGALLFSGVFTTEGSSPCLSPVTFEYHEVLQAARQRQRTGEFKEQYVRRAGIEGTLSQGVRAFDLRRSRYMGLAKTHLQHILIATALNLVRVVAWLTDPRPQKRRGAPLAALAFAAWEFANRVSVGFGPSSMRRKS